MTLDSYKSLSWIIFRNLPRTFDNPSTFPSCKKVRGVLGWVGGGGSGGGLGVLVGGQFLSF